MSASGCLPEELGDIGAHRGHAGRAADENDAVQLAAALSPASFSARDMRRPCARAVGE